MVGPVVKVDPARLPRRPNIHRLGQQPYDVLPQLVAGWEVCPMPLALNESTRFMSQRWRRASHATRGMTLPSRSTRQSAAF